METAHHKGKKFIVQKINMNLNILYAHLKILLKQQFKGTNKSKLNILLIKTEILKPLRLYNLKITSCLQPRKV